MNGTRSIHTVECDLARKRHEGLILTTTWVQLGHMVLSEEPGTNDHRVCGCVDMQCPEQANP